MGETYQQLLIRVRSSEFVPPPEPTGAIMAKPVQRKKGQKVSFSRVRGSLKYPWDKWFSTEEGAVGVCLPEDSEERAEYDSLDDAEKRQWREDNHLLLLEQSVGDKDKDGNVTNVTEKRDYELRTSMMPAKVKFAARRRYLNADVTNHDLDGNKLIDSLIVHVYPMTSEQRIKEDERRAHEEKRDKEAKAKRERATSSNGTTVTPPEATPPAKSPENATNTHQQQKSPAAQPAGKKRGR